MEGAIKTAVLSVTYNPDQDDDARTAASFSIDETGTPFVYTDAIGGALMYTTDGKIPTASPDMALMIVASSLGPVPAEGQQKELAMNRLARYPDGENNVIREIKPITIDGMSGYEIVADGEHEDGRKQLMYQVMLFDASGYYYIIAGMTDGNFEAYLAHFKTVAQTFKRK